MAFYFALLNVSSRKEEKPRVRRRRHSIASVESPLHDYRLLPRPRVVSKELLREDNDDSDEPGPSVPRRSRHRHEDKTMRKSESSYTNFRRSEHSSGRERSSESKLQHKESEPDSDDPQPRKSEKSNRKDDKNSGIQPHRIWTPEMIITLKNDLTPTDKPSCLMMTSKTTRNLQVGKVASDTPSSSLNHMGSPDMKLDKKRRKDDKRSKSSDKDQSRRLLLQASNHEKVEYHDHNATSVTRPARRGKGGRPLVIKRRISPTESTTSGSRRSSKESQRSLPRRESPVSSIASSRENDHKQTLISPQCGSKGNYITKVTNEIQKVPQLKKVTFETASSPYVMNRSFLGDRAVLVRRLSGCETVLRTSTLPQLEKLVIPHSGEEWLSHLNLANRKPSNSTARTKPGKSCLLRRRSTSDRRHVVLTYDAAIAKGLMTLSVDRPPNL